MSYQDLFLELNKQGIRYVIPRRYDSLPESTINGGRDVDIVIEPTQFQFAVEIPKKRGFTPEQKSGSSRLRVYRGALAQPKKAIQLLLQEPRDSISKIIYGNEIQYGNPRHEVKHLYRGSQMIDLQNNLAYESPMDGTMIPVDPSVTDGMLSRRKKEACFYIPTPADELAHLIPHCVFNKAGGFPSYYADRCDELLEVVRSTDELLQLFKQLLEKIFYNADQLVFELVADKRYSDIRPELKQFSDY